MWPCDRRAYAALRKSSAVVPPAGDSTDWRKGASNEIQDIIDTLPLAVRPCSASPFDCADHLCNGYSVATTHSGRPREWNWRAAVEDTPSCFDLSLFSRALFGFELPTAAAATSAESGAGGLLIARTQ